MEDGMKERPILFSGPMVRAILEGRKTQTRRVLKPQPELSDGYWWLEHKTGRTGLCRDGKPVRAGIGLYCPYGRVGDRLRISEAVKVECFSEDWYSVTYTADGLYLERPCDAGLMQRIKNYKTGVLCGVHLPAAYARPDRLELTGVRVERLHDISNADIIGEGIQPIGDEKVVASGHRTQVGKLDGRYSTLRQLWSELWMQINGPGSWAANPWVWVIEFKRIEQ